MDRLTELRETYERGALDEDFIARDPRAQFRIWLDEALVAKIVEPNAMTLCSVGKDGRPSARVVLLRGYDERGLVFFTNYESRKGRELDARPYAAITFYWGELQRQLRVEGDVERLDDAASDAYFSKRPRGHRLSAWASPQSQIVGGRAELDRRMHEVEARFPDEDVPRPPHWGGYRVVPNRFEFWQGRPNRVHDRIVYVRADEGWEIVRLAP